MKIALYVVIAILLAGVAVLYVPSLWSGPPSAPSKLPVAPATVSSPGVYFIDATRYVEIRRVGSTLVLIEGTQTTIPTAKVLSLYTSIEREIMPLKRGWNIGLRPPDTLVIDDGSGTATTRTHGSSKPMVVTSGSITRKPAPPSSGMARIISKSQSAGEVTPIPIPETIPATPCPHSEDNDTSP